MKQNPKKSRFFKIFSGLSLITLITCGTTLLATTQFGVGVDANAAAGANINLSNNSQTTTNSGLITPQEDDPVLFKTESGLEIKWGNTTITTQIGVGETTGMKGYCYFITNDGSKDYVWIIIGKATDVNTKFPVDYIASNWIDSSDYFGNERNEFMGNQYENESPAGTIIYNELVSHLDRVIGNDIVSNSEIPSGSILCLANDAVATGVWNNTNKAVTYPYDYGTAYHYNSTYSSQALGTAMNGYYTNGTFGLSNIKDKIVGVPITTTGRSGTDTWTPITETLYVYPLAGKSEEKFFYSRYLATSHGLTSFSWWLRTNTGSIYHSHGSYMEYYYPTIYYVKPDGTISSTSCGSSLSHRPAFCLSLA